MSVRRAYGENEVRTLQCLGIFIYLFFYLYLELFANYENNLKA